MDNNKVEAKVNRVGKVAEQEQRSTEQARLEIAEKLKNLKNWLHGCVLDDIKSNSFKMIANCIIK